MQFLKPTNQETEKRIRQVGKIYDDAYHFRRQKIADNKLEENNISSSILAD
jgi:hypothetical protein